MGQSILDELKCPYINHEKAEFFGTHYFCDYDNMEFESMTAHCQHCEMYKQLYKMAMNFIYGKATPNDKQN